MKSRTRRNLMLMGVAFIGGAAGALLYLREPTEPLTHDLLSQARQRWRAAGIHSYELRYRMHGGEYLVRLRDGRVEEVTVNGQTPTSGDWNVYTVEGLFDTLAQELDNLADPAGPFAGRAQTILMRVRFNPEWGFVERYLRSSGGIGRGASIEDVRLRRLSE